MKLERLIYGTLYITDGTLAVSPYRIERHCGPADSIYRRAFVDHTISRVPSVIARRLNIVRVGQ